MAVSDSQDQRRRRCTIVIHNDRDGNGVDAVYTRLAVSDSPILHNSGDETSAHVCEPATSHNLYLICNIYKINYIIMLYLKTIRGEKKNNNIRI